MLGTINRTVLKPEISNSKRIRSMTHVHFSIIVTKNYNNRHSLFLVKPVIKERKNK